MLQRWERCKMPTGVYMTKLCVCFFYFCQSFMEKDKFFYTAFIEDRK